MVDRFGSGGGFGGGRESKRFKALSFGGLDSWIMIDVIMISTYVMIV